MYILGAYLLEQRVGEHLAKASNLFEMILG